MKDFHEIRAWILAWLERELDVPANDIACDKSLLTYGMDSVNAIMLVGDLENQLKLRLPPTMLWDHPSVDALTRALVAELAPPTSTNAHPANDEHAGQPAPSNQLSQQEAEQLLENIDQLSDDQINELLERLNQG